jgi:hypothetical protein
MGMQQMIRIARDEPHQMPGFEPEAFVPDRAPEEEQRAAIDLPTGMSQFIELGCPAYLNPAHGVLRGRFYLWFTHTDLFFVAGLKPERQGLKPRKTRLSARSEGTAACGGFNLVISLPHAPLLTTPPRDFIKPCAELKFCLHEWTVMLRVKGEM